MKLNVLPVKLKETSSISKWSRILNQPSRLRGSSCVPAARGDEYDGESISWQVHPGALREWLTRFQISARRERLGGAPTPPQPIEPS